jgi:predicted nuclease with TOPRIM domain
MELVKNKLEKIEAAVVELREEREDRDKKVEEVTRTMKSLQVAIEQIHTALTELNTGTHAMVHRWAEDEMKARAEQREFRKNLIAALWTKAASTILMLFAFLVAFGIYSYIKEVSEDVHDEVSITLDTKPNLEPPKPFD